MAEPVIDISDADVAAYDRDGVVCLRGAFDAGWIERLRGAVEHNLANPGPLSQTFTKPGQPGRFHGDKYMWTFDDDFRAFVFDSPGAAIAARLMGSEKVNFFFDHLLVKEPGTAEATPWHQDQPYWCVDGWQVISIWLALDPVPAEVSPQYIRGSHRWGKWYDPASFGGDREYRSGGEKMPDIDAARDQYDIASFALEPGDVIVHQALVIHGAPANASNGRRRGLATRWLGDDVRYAVREAVPQIIRDPGLKAGDRMDCELFPVVWRQPAEAA